MADALTQACAQHESPFECPDNLIYWSPRLDEYGLIVHDGGSSYVVISTCPWCGRKLPNSRREARANGDSTSGGDPSHSEELAHRFSGSFTIPAPRGWSFRESLAIHADPDTSVTAESDPAYETADSKEYADMRRSQDREQLPNYKEISYQPANLLGGRKCWVRTFEWGQHDDERVTEIEVDCVADGRRYTVTATATPARFAAVEHQLMTILEGVFIAKGS